MNAVSDIGLFLAGDVMTGRGVDQVMATPSDPTLHESWVRDAGRYVALAERVNGPVPAPVGPGYVWGDALAVLEAERPDLKIVNLETSITTSDAFWPGKGIHYRMHPDNASCLAAAGIDCCVLANNHVLDWGHDGLLQTLETLDENRIATAGAGRDLRAAASPARLSTPGGARVLVFAAADASSGVPAAWSAGANDSGVCLLPDLSAATADGLAAAIDAGRRADDVVIVSLHWGDNWGWEVPGEHTAFAHRLLDSGMVDVLHGHSSHHARPVEVYRRKLVLYGCGDLLNDYEGISGHRSYRPWLAPMYFLRLDASSGDLAGLHIVVLQVRRLQLARASPDDEQWFAAALDRISRPRNAAFRLDGGRVSLRPGHSPERD